MTKDQVHEIIMEWKFFWMDQTQNSEEDFKNYFRRAFGVDANMAWDLADRISKKINATSENLKTHE